MRTVSRARWAACALAIILVVVLVVPAAAERHRRSLDDCARFDQADHGEDAVAFTIHNACALPIDCAVSWRVVCAPQSMRRRAVHPASAKLAIAEGVTQRAEASAAACGKDSWLIDSVRWRCQPSND